MPCRAPRGLQLRWMGDSLTCASCRRAVPFEEDDGDSSIWFLDHSYAEIMYKMFKKVNGKPYWGALLHVRGAEVMWEAVRACQVSSMHAMHACIAPFWLWTWALRDILISCYV